MKIGDIVKVAQKFSIDNSPLLLTAVGVAGTLTTAILTGKASYKAAHHIRDYEESQLLPPDSVHFKGKVRLTWQLYIPPVASGALTVTAIIFANRIGTRRAAAMAAAYALSEKAFEEYREHVVEKLGSSKEKGMRDEIAQNRVSNNRVGVNEVVITGGGDVLCFDMYTSRYFRSDMETLKKAQNDLNYQILHHMYASLNDFYDKIGLNHIPIGEEVGWNSDEQLELFFSATISDDQKPCIAVDFRTKPIRNYFRVHGGL